MSQFNFVRRCHSCGAILQSDDPNASGYIDADVLANLQARVLFCNHCFADARYNFSPSDPKVDEDIATMLEDAESTDALIVYVVDLFSFENSFIPEITEIIQGLPMVVVANKRDLLPADCSDEDLREYVAHRFRVAHLSCTSDDVMLCSLHSESDVSGVFEMINTRRRAHDVFVIGAKFSGKTQLISSLLHGYVNPTNRSISTITYPGTALQVMQIPLDNSSFLYDTPGTSLSNSLSVRVDAKSRGVIAPKKEVEPRKIVLDLGDTLFLGGVARIELIQGERTILQFFASPKVDTLRTGSKEAEALFFKKIKKEALLPLPSFQPSPVDYDAYDLQITESTRRDIGIAGLGWFNFQGKGQTFRIYVLKGVGIYASRPKVKLDVE